MNNDLNRLSSLLQDAVEHGEYAGASVMVLRKGEEIYYADCGYADVESGVKIARDTIFRIYSQSKPLLYCFVKKYGTNQSSKLNYH